jgi:hypothetical protein
MTTLEQILTIAVPLILAVVSIGILVRLVWEKIRNTMNL